MQNNSKLVPYIESRVPTSFLCDADVIAFDNSGFYILKPLYPVSRSVYQCEVVREGVGTIIT